ncbi:MAG: PriCT-2 domain-containing protein [Burkholderiaceae bacterium]
MIHNAIRAIPADDRETWVQVGMAVKAELGNDGFDLWNSWSQSSDRYNKQAAAAVWRSIKAHGGITGRTLYKLAREYGWKGEEGFTPTPRPAQRDTTADRAEAMRRAQAAKEAAYIVSQCHQDRHPYLERKGFKDELGLIDFDGRLVIPMRNVTDYRRIQSVQFIDGQGEKKFLPGGAAKNAVFFIGSGKENWLCEGFATGLSIHAALKMISRNARVVVCFSAANTRSVAAELPSPKYIVADHDKNRVGERYAIEAGCPFVMAPEVGMDANDYHMKSGTLALSMLLMEALRQK